MKISVLTPSFNSGRFIERAIKSVLKQGYKNYEHIIVDGNSNDQTIDILKKYNHITYISETDSGQSDAMNKAFSLSTGEIIVYLNADDEFADNTFEHIIDTFNQHPKSDFIVGDLLFNYPGGILLRKPSTAYFDIIQYWLNLFPNNPVSYFYKRHVQEEIGKLPEDNHFAMDMWFLLHAYKKFKILKIDKILGTFHSDGTNKTAVNDSGKNLHKTVKNHLKSNDPFLLPIFYIKLILYKSVLKKIYKT